MLDAFAVLLSTTLLKTKRIKEAVTKFNGLRCDGGHEPLSSPFQIFILGVFSSKVSSERRGEVFFTSKREVCISQIQVLIIEEDEICVKRR